MTEQERVELLTLVRALKRIVEQAKFDYENPGYIYPLGPPKEEIEGFDDLDRGGSVEPGVSYTPPAFIPPALPATQPAPVGVKGIMIGGKKKS